MIFNEEKQKLNQKEEKTTKKRSDLLKYRKKAGKKRERSEIRVKQLPILLHRAREIALLRCRISRRTAKGRGIEGEIELVRVCRGS